MTNLKHWKDLFRTIRQVYDCDKNGFISIDELIEQFNLYYPQQLEGKAMNQMLKKYQSTYDKTLINYKQFREEIG